MAQSRFWTTLVSIIGVLGILIGINMLVEGRLGRAQLDLTAGKHALHQGVHRHHSLRATAVVRIAWG